MLQLFILVLLVSPLRYSYVSAQPCSGETCQECLEKNKGCAWAIGTCLDSCSQIADAACYSFEYFLNQTAAEICAVEETSKANAALCNAKDSCDTCVDTFLLDGTTRCQWFGSMLIGSGGYCASGCNMQGCGKTTCDDDGGGLPESPSNLPCNNKKTCNECLSQDCAWIEGDCYESCDVIANTSCYAAENFPNLTGAEICAIHDDAEANAALCNEQDNCGSCVATILSDGESHCQWFEFESFCGSECNFAGCGETTCFANCTGAASCEDCLGQSDACAWAIGECHQSCLQDVACYSSKNFPSLTVLQICAVEDAAIADDELCESQDNCTGCIDTVLTDGSSRCRWFEIGGRCQNGCTMQSCGSSTCQNDTISCKGDTCEACLQSGDCAWAVGECLESCATIADASCYSPQRFPNRTAAEICQAEDDDLADAALCDGKDSCADCVVTVLSDGTSHCRWFEEADGGFCGSECNSIGCGATTCKNDVVMCKGDTCEACLQSGDCAWAVGECLESCSMIADASCYSAKYFPNFTVSEICDADATEASDAALCASKETCGDCVATVLTDGSNRCQWLEVGSLCQSGCNLLGCGSSNCSSLSTTSSAARSFVSFYTGGLVALTLSLVLACC